MFGDLFVCIDKDWVLDFTAVTHQGLYGIEELLGPLTF
jgi:hypothetical protein